MSNITIAQAQDALKNLPFPEVTEGDTIWYPGGPPEGDKGYRFKYENEKWISYPE